MSQKTHGCTEALKTADKIKAYRSKNMKKALHKDLVHIKLFFKLRK